MRPATLRPYPEYPECRPVALRPTLSSGLPFSGVSLDSDQRERSLILRIDHPDAREETELRL